MCFAKKKSNHFITYTFRDTYQHLNKINMHVIKTKQKQLIILFHNGFTHMRKLSEAFSKTKISTFFASSRIIQNYSNNGQFQTIVLKTISRAMMKYNFILLCIRIYYLYLRILRKL